MALLKSKQIKDVAAAKVVQTAERRFVTDQEIAVFNDKYTKQEANDLFSSADANAQADATAKADAAQAAAIAAAAIDATQKADAAEAAAVATAGADATAKATAAQAALDAVRLELEADASNKAGAAEANAKTYTDGVKTTLQSQITNSIAGLTWKAPVATFMDILTAYPEPEEGYMVTVDDTNKVFRYDATTTSWVDFPIQAPHTYQKSILLNVQDNATKLHTGITNNGDGVLNTAYPDIVLSVNGFVQQAGADMDFVANFENNELVVTWLNRGFTLETSDEVSVTYTQVG